MGVKVINRFPDITAPGFNFPEWNKQFRAGNVIINDSHSSVYFPLHWTTFSLKCAFGGTEFYVINKMKYGVYDNVYLLLNEDTMYESYIDSLNKVESFTLNFTKAFTEDVYSSIIIPGENLFEYPSANGKQHTGFFEKLYPQNPLLFSYLKDLRKLVNSNFRSDGLLEEKMHFILELLFLEQHSTVKQINNLDEKKPSTRFELFRRLNMAKDYIHSNYREKIELNDLGMISCLSPHYLLRKFKKHFGITPHQYLTARRLEFAREILLKSAKTISEICTECGFESHSSFTALFKKHYKIPPGKFRIENRTSEQYG